MPEIIEKKLLKEEKFIKSLERRVEFTEKFQLALRNISGNLLFFLITVFVVWNFAYRSGLNSPLFVVCTDFDSNCYKMRNGLKAVEQRSNPEKLEN